MKKGIVGATLGLLLVVGGLMYAQVTKNVTISVSAGIAGDVVDAYAFVYNYQVNVPNPDYCPQEEFDLGNCTPLDETEWISNPESENQFALRMFEEQAQENIRQVYIAYMTQQGADAAAAQAAIDAAGITVQ